VFGTRSPHRPNPIGLSAVKLERIDGLTLYVADIDMLDGTPVLDIKPYVAYTDAIATTENGWLDDSRADPVPAFEVQWDAAAASQAEWIEARTNLPLRERATATLVLGPTPQPYRRIRPLGDSFVLSVKEWRVRFSVEERIVRVHDITSGFREAQLVRGDAPEIVAHREFRARFA
jgi:hypothetical protein